MANPTRIVMERAIRIAFPIAVAQNLIQPSSSGFNPTTVRAVNPEIDTYGLPAGDVLVSLEVGDVITDPTCIATILGVTSGQTATFPSGLVPHYSVF